LAADKMRASVWKWGFGRCTIEGTVEGNAMKVNSTASRVK
jgi:hypothetical protein